MPLAEITVDTATGALISYTSQYGAGPEFAPRLIVGGAPGGFFALDWDAAYQDFDGTYHAFNVRAAEVTVQGSTAILCSVQVNVFGLSLGISFNDLAAAPANPVASITVWGEWLPDRQIGDYDGATDKTDSLTEGDSSYCYDWFVEFQAMRGSAYSTSLGNVDAENFAMARQFGALNRNAEKFEANSLPGTSDEKLENWVEILGVSVRKTDQRWQVRQRCAAKLKAAASGALPDDIDSAVRDLLGASFIAVHRTIGATLDMPPAGTQWPVINPGGDAYSLGGGAWVSPRSFLWVEVVQPGNANDSDFFRLMDVDLFELLDLRLPAHMTFNWATGSGFLIGVSPLGFTAL